MRRKDFDLKLQRPCGRLATSYFKRHVVPIGMLWFATAFAYAVVALIASRDALYSLNLDLIRFFDPVLVVCLVGGLVVLGVALTITAKLFKSGSASRRVVLRGLEEVTSAAVHLACGTFLVFILPAMSTGLDESGQPDVLWLVVLILLAFALGMLGHTLRLRAARPVSKLRAQ